MEIRIGKSSRICEVCAREFAHEQTIHSVATFAEEGFARTDYCDACWTSDFGHSAYSSWATKFYDPRIAEQQPPEVFSPLRRLFYDASSSEDRLELAKAFLAAQLLKRQKVFRQLKESDTHDGEIRLTLYADRIGNRLIEVRDPSFTYSELDAARTSLLKRLRELEDETITGDAPADSDSGHAANSTASGEPVHDGAENSASVS